VGDREIQITLPLESERRRRIDLRNAPSGDVDGNTGKREDETDYASIAMQTLVNGISLLLGPRIRMTNHRHVRLQMLLVASLVGGIFVSRGNAQAVAPVGMRPLSSLRLIVSHGDLRAAASEPAPTTVSSAPLVSAATSARSHIVLRAVTGAVVGGVLGAVLANKYVHDHEPFCARMICIVPPDHSKEYRAVGIGAGVSVGVLVGVLIP
jgi:hypothetical protein